MNHNHDRRQDEKRDATPLVRPYQLNQHLVGRFIEGSCGLENAVYPPELVQRTAEDQEQKGRSPRQDPGRLVEDHNKLDNGADEHKTGDDRRMEPRDRGLPPPKLNHRFTPGHDSMTGPQKRHRVITFAAKVSSSWRAEDQRDAVHESRAGEAWSLVRNLHLLHPLPSLNHTSDNRTLPSPFDLTLVDHQVWLSLCIGSRGPFRLAASITAMH